MSDMPLPTAFRAWAGRPVVVCIMFTLNTWSPCLACGWFYCCFGFVRETCSVGDAGIETTRIKVFVRSWPHTFTCTCVSSLVFSSPGPTNTHTPARVFYHNAERSNTNPSYISTFVADAPSCSCLLLLCDLDVCRCMCVREWGCAFSLRFSEQKSVGMSVGMTSFCDRWRCPCRCVSVVALLCGLQLQRQWQLSPCGIRTGVYFVCHHAVDFSVSTAVVDRNFSSTGVGAPRRGARGKANGGRIVAPCGQRGPPSRSGRGSAGV